MPEETKTIQYNETKRQEAFAFSVAYEQFLNACKTEREAVTHTLALAEKAGYTDGFKAKNLKAGDKVYFINRAKNIALLHVGHKPLSEGFNLVAAHTDSPRLDLKPAPLTESGQLAFLKTHYYGGIKKYQWVNIPLALHGVVVLKDGTTHTICLGEAADDPIFLIPDLLPHLSAKIQGERKATELIKGEELQIIIGSEPLMSAKEDAKNPIKMAVLEHLNRLWGMEEEDFFSAELTAVPAGPVRELGLDRGMLAGYGHDDKMCSYAAVRAILDLEQPPQTSVMTFLADKEEIGSTGSTGMQSDFLMYVVAKALQAVNLPCDQLHVMECLWRSVALSADVNATLNPMFKEVHDLTNAPTVNAGITISKYTGSGGKFMANDADAELVAGLRQLLHKHQVPHQFGELGKVDEGGGGTVAQFLAHRGMAVIDCGGPVLSMHAPLEIISKLDLYANYETYKYFFVDGIKL